MHSKPPEPDYALYQSRKAGAKTSTPPLLRARTSMQQSSFLTLQRPSLQASPAEYPSEISYIHLPSSSPPRPARPHVNQPAFLFKARSNHRGLNDHSVAFVFLFPAGKRVNRCQKIVKLSSNSRFNVKHFLILAVSIQQSENVKPRMLSCYSWSGRPYIRRGGVVWR